MSKPTTYAGRYLYCFIAAEKAERAFEVLPVPVPNGENSDRVYAIKADRVAAIVSDSPSVRYPVARNSLLAHELVLEYIMQEMPILPVKYGTVASSETDLLQRLLIPREAELAELLEKFSTRIEVSVKAIWQRDKIFAEIANLPEIVQLKAKVGVQDQNAKITLGQMVEQVLGEMRDRDAARILEVLSPLACEVKQNPITLDMLVLNAAFLIEKDREAAFDEAVNRLDDEIGERIKLKYAGPLPPFNFVHFNLSTVED